MDMKICSNTVKTLRTNKLWSQEELATACGVSLRTIQRLEGEGQASADTLKALASVFEVDYDVLKRGGNDTSVYINIQLGYATIMIAVVIVTVLAMLLQQGLFGIWAFTISIACIAAICAVFSTLTTRVDKDKLEWHFGFGLLRQAIAIADILSSESVRNKAWWGLGIRLTPHGWLYCVSGLDAVALRLANGRKVRIGTDEAEALNRAIEVACSKASS